VGLLLKRLLEAVAVIVGISILVFVILRLSGDPVALLLPQEASEEDFIRLRHELGFDRSILVQYLIFAGNALRGDFGDSIRSFVPAIDLVFERLPATILLAVAALSVAIAIAFPAGVIAGLNRNTAIDRVVMVASVIGQGMPVFWLSLLLILVFSVHLHLLPTSGYGRIEHLVLPASALGLYTAARLSRLIRSGVIDVASQDFVRGAHAKGLPRRWVISRYIVRNALLPIVTVIGLDFTALLGGAVITETIFGWPGVGRLTIESIGRRDFPVIQASVMLLATIYVLVNFAIDIIYTMIDPRIRIQ
jgi:peptide/nickel transport system permease protein